MNSLYFVVCIVAIVFTATTVQQYLKLRAGKQDSSSGLRETLSKLDRIEKTHAGSGAHSHRKKN